MNQNSARTAIKRVKPSAPLKFILETFGDSIKDRTILDYGCGHGYDVKYLCENGFNAYGWDPYNSDNDFPDNTFDIVLLTYVLNTIETDDDIKCTLQSAWNKVTDKGMLIITGRRAKEVLRAAKKGHWKVVNHGGFLTNSGSFQGIISNDVKYHILNLPLISSYDIVSKSFIMYIARKGWQ